MKSLFQDIIEYNFTMNENIISRFEEHAPAISEKAHLLLSHIINAQHIWNHRILNETPLFGVWEIIPLEKLKEMNLRNIETAKKIVSEINLEKTIAYKNSKGEAFENSVKDIMFHALNHATYHRAQIATELKNAGIEPIISDFIYYKR